MKHNTFTTPGKLLVAAVFLGVVLLWVASLFVVPVLVGWYFDADRCVQTPSAESALASCKDLAALFGTFGDAFGAINALFSGLALAGVVLTLFLHSEGARRAAKPFIVPKLARLEPAARVSIRDPERVDGSVRLPLQISIPIHNASSHVALNTRVRFEIEGFGLGAESAPDIPLAPGNEEVVTLAVDIEGQRAQRFVGALCKDGAFIGVKVTYESIEGVRWSAGARYQLIQNQNREEDRQLLEAAINGQLAAQTPWTSETTVELDFLTVPGSWHFEETS